MTTLKSVYQEIELAYTQKNWYKIRVLSQNDIVRNPTRPNLKILRIILKSLAKSITKSKKLPSRPAKPSIFTLQQQPTEMLLLMAENMKIEDVLSLCETNKAFNKGICKKDNFWRQRLERDFGSTKREGKRNYFQEYVIKYKLRRQRILSEYNKHPGLELQINIWLNGTSKNLVISNLGLREWPEALKGKGHLIVNLYCDNNLLISLPALPKCEKLFCSINLLTSLPVLTKCMRLHCSHNLLLSLPALPECVKLYCYYNQLTTLPFLTKCETLWCYNNRLTFLPELPSIVSPNQIDAQNNPFPPNYTHRLL